MQIIHWLSALVILLMIPIGVIMVRMEASPLQTTLFRVHVTLGLSVLLLTAVRLVCRFIRPIPDTPEGITGARKILFQGIHFLQYLVIILLIITGLGILRNSGLGFLPTQVTPEAIDITQPGVQIHRLLGYSLALLVLLHVGGVLDYQFRHKQDALGRMGVTWFS
jgi:cytochrome b561